MHCVESAVAGGRRPAPQAAEPTFLAVAAVEAPRALARVGVSVHVTGASVEAGVRVTRRRQRCGAEDGHPDVLATTDARLESSCWLGGPLESLVSHFLIFQILPSLFCELGLSWGPQESWYQGHLVACHHRHR